MTQAGHNRLAELANVVAAEHRHAEAAARKALEHALAAGDALLEAKSAVEHGQWSAWLAANVPDVSARTAQLYMKLARNRGSLDPQRVADLSLRQAAKMVSESKPHPTHVDIDEYLDAKRPPEDGEIEIPIEQVKFRRELYTRATVDQDAIERYSEFLADLPPIEVNQNYELIDGFFRLEAHRKKGASTIRVVVTETAGDYELLQLACRRNSRHALPLSLDKEREARRRFGPQFKRQRPEHIGDGGAA
jgi:hypothetical protein